MTGLIARQTAEESYKSYARRLTEENILEAVEQTKSTEEKTAPATPPQPQVQAAPPADNREPTPPASPAPAGSTQEPSAMEIAESERDAAFKAAEDALDAMQTMVEEAEKKEKEESRRQPRETRAHIEARLEKLARMYESKKNVNEKQDE
jgi:hypothetical protein